MNSNLLIGLGFIVVLAGCASSGGPVADSGAETTSVDVRVVEGPADQANAETNPDEVICQRVHQVGSHFPRTVCKTRREIEQERANAEDALRRQQNAGVRAWSGSRNNGG